MQRAATSGLRPFCLVFRGFLGTPTARAAGLAELLGQRRIASRLPSLDMAQFDAGLRQIGLGPRQRAIGVGDGLLQPSAPASDGRIDEAALLWHLQLQKIAAQALGKAFQFLEVPLFLAAQPAVDPKHMVKGSH